MRLEFNEQVARQFKRDSILYAPVLDEIERRLSSQKGTQSMTTTNIDTRNDAKYIAEFKAEPQYAKSMTQDQYVSMRRVDDGLALLIPDKPAAPQQFDPKLNPLFDPSLLNER